MTKNPASALILWLALPITAGLIGSRFLPGDWCPSLSKPTWNPPNSVFAPVWSTLYVLMGIVAWLARRKAGFAGARLALGMFIVQLVRNFPWSFPCFGARQPGLAIVVVVVFWLVILATTIRFWRVSVPAGTLLVPYPVLGRIRRRAQFRALAPEFASAARPLGQQAIRGGGDRSRHGSGWRWLRAGADHRSTPGVRADP